MKKATILALSLATGLISMQANAADKPAGDKPHEGRPGHHRMAEADTNKDGAITREEFHAQGDKIFDKLDTNHDGKITKEEGEARRQEYKAKRDEMVKKFDTNKDGKLSEDERAAARKEWEAKKAAHKADE